MRGPWLCIATVVIRIVVLRSLVLKFSAVGISLRHIFITLLKCFLSYESASKYPDYGITLSMSKSS